MKRELLVKILNLTQSDSDGEALSAIRKANKALKDAGLTWDTALKPERNKEPERTRQHSFYEHDNFEEDIFADILNQMRKSKY